MKRKLICLILSFCLVGSIVACGDTTGQTNTESTKDSELISDSQENAKNYEFISVFSSQDSISLNSQEEKVFAIDKDISGKEYIKVTIKTNANLVGKFTYKNVDNSKEVVSEDFFIEPSNNVVEFKQFFDAFRLNGVGQFDKHLISVSLKNVDANKATVELKDVSVAERDVPALEKELYIEKDNLKVGADLAMGGTLSYLEKTAWEDFTIDEIINYDNEVYIGVDAKKKAMRELSSSVNLINIYDAGREIQQSYYADVGGSMKEATGANGYDRRWSFTATREGYYWPYNPVQGGDEVCNVSQIIDYEVGNNYIYVKVRAMDWGNGYARPEYSHLEGYEAVKGGRTTKSYIENWYTIKDGMLYVDNRFIDWNGFTDMQNIAPHTLEVPATYVVHPLSTYVCYNGNDKWNLNDESYDVQDSLEGWWAADTVHLSSYHPEDWFAWVNDEFFGVGVYVPGTAEYHSGRNDTLSLANMTNNSSAFTSPMANEFLYNKKAPTSKYTSCYVGNTSYTAPVVGVKMKEYVPLSYSYVIAVDYLDVIRSNFKKVYESGTILNEGLKAWD